MKQLKHVLLLILIGLATCTFGQELACKKFKNGKFKIVDPEHGDSFIERKGSKQIEYGSGSNLKLEFKVEWLNPCTYTLELTKILENPEKIELPEGMILKIEILETKENSYVQRSSSNLYDMVLESELIKMD